MKLETRKDYLSKLDVRETQIAIKDLKDFFERELAKKLNLTRVSAPLFVQADTGLNDNLSGVEKPISFSGAGIDNLQIVHSLAKWKRNALYRYGFKPYTGIYTDMNAIRKDEEVSNFHSLYVDQWDWEMIIKKDDRSDEILEKIVNDIYSVFYETEQHINTLYPKLSSKLPKDIFFITSQALLDLYPDLTPKGREIAITKEHKAVFIKQIGKRLSDGTKHDGRAPDYDDWELNGDIIFYHPILDTALELSSMGIRVDKASLSYQLELSNTLERLSMQYHKDVHTEKLPLTVGGGIGQSRLCLFFLEKMHIGEVQVSVWPEEMVEACYNSNIKLL
jgi:aspartate--ammonia ligase